MSTEPVAIRNKDGDLAGIGYTIKGKEDRGIQVRMFTHERVQSLKEEVELRIKLNAVTKEEAIMSIVRRMQ